MSKPCFNDQLKACRKSIEHWEEIKKDLMDNIGEMYRANTLGAATIELPEGKYIAFNIDVCPLCKLNSSDSGFMCEECILGIFDGVCDRWCDYTTWKKFWNVVVNNSIISMLHVNAAQNMIDTLKKAMLMSQDQYEKATS